MRDSVDQQSEEEILRRALVRLNAKVLGLIFGLVLGLLIFIMTNWLVLAGGHVNAQGELVIGPHLALLGHFFPGYRVTFLGSIIGFVYGFVLGTITGTAIGVLHNRFSSLRARRKSKD